MPRCEERTTTLVQCQWQNHDDLNERRFVAQGEFSDAEDAVRWSSMIFETHWNQKPPGDWMPLVCTQSSHYFMSSATNTDKE